MPREATLHVKLDAQTDEKLTRLARARWKSKGQLVREAIAACYQAALDELPLRQQRAVAAYLGGFISTGKLARELGLHILELRNWLSERGLEQPTAYSDADASRA